MLSDVSYWTLRGLAITNHGKTVGVRNGIQLHVSFAGIATSLHLVDVDVSDVNGEVGSKSSGGIGVLAWGKNGKGARFDDLLIDHCTIKHVDGQGIWFHVKNGGVEDDDEVNPQYPNTRIRIANTTIEDTGRNAIFLRDSMKALIDHNTIRYSSARTHGNAVVIAWSKDTVVRNNEVAFTGLKQGTGENGAFDADDGAAGTVFEYNWTHDNAGGSVNIVNDPRKKTPNVGTIVRYNLSENDQARIFGLGGAVQYTLIYNNTVFIGKHDSPHLLSAGRFVAHVPGDPNDVAFLNNVIYSQGSFDYDLSASHVAFDSNCYIGKHPGGGPKDEHKTTANDSFDLASIPAHSWQDIANYKTAGPSTCIAAGLAITDNGGQDILGTPLTTATAMTRGAFVLVK